MSLFSSVALIDQLADSWRWWSVPGAFLGILLLTRRMVALSSGLPDTVDGTVLEPFRRASTTISAMIFMLGVLIAGLAIPLASDGRMLGFDTDGVLFRHIIAAVWLLWGSGCWGITVSVAPRWREMVSASVVLWFAAYVAIQKTTGALL